MILSYSITLCDSIFLLTSNIIMTDFDELKQTKAQCLRDITEALPDYVNRLNSIDTRLLTYIDDAISNNASHANLMELLGIRKEMRLIVLNTNYTNFPNFS